MIKREYLKDYTVPGVTAFCKKMNISRQTFYKWYRGEARFPTFDFTNLSDDLKMSLFLDEQAYQKMRIEEEKKNV